ncbi:MAG: hypothetical protein Kow0068_01160 [Marinilabiliales bacterium]
MKHILFIIILLPLTILSQTVLLEEYPGKDTIPEKKGPNRKYFHHLYLGIGSFVDQIESNQAKILYTTSNNFVFGFKYKYKLSNTFSFGWDLYLLTDNYKFKQDTSKTFPDTLIHKRAKLLLTNLGGDIYFRINFGKHGNTLGKFIDIAPYGTLICSSNYITIDKFDSNNSSLNYAGKIKTEYSNLDYIDLLQYGVRISIGIERFTLNFSYRLSDYIKSKYSGYPELPRFSASIQIALY